MVNNELHSKIFKEKIIKIICILSVIFGGAFIIVQSIQTLTSFLTIFMATQQASDCGDSGDGGPLTLDSTSGSGDSKVRAVAKAIANSLGIDAASIYAQIALESADGNSYLAKTDNNFGGIKYSPALSQYATRVQLQQMEVVVFMLTSRALTILQLFTEILLETC